MPRPPLPVPPAAPDGDAPSEAAAGVAPLRRLVASPAFGRVVLGLIVLAALLVGLETSPAFMARFGTLAHTLDTLIIWLFAAEAALKIVAGGRRWYDYFRDPWNVFDFVIVVVCFLPVEAKYAQVLRLARVLRALRLVSAVPRLQLLVSALLTSLPSMFFVGLLLLILFYVYAVTGVFLFRDNDPVHFGTLPRSFLSLFRVVTLEDWTDVMYIQMFGSDRYPFSEQDRAAYVFASRAQPLIGVAYFCSFVVLGTMIMLNLFIGIILKSMDEAQEEGDRALRARHLEENGEPTLGDELALVEKQVDALSAELRRLRQRARAAHAAR